MHHIDAFEKSDRSDTGLHGRRMYRNAIKYVALKTAELQAVGTTLACFKRKINARAAVRREEMGIQTMQGSFNGNTVGQTWKGTDSQI